MGRPATYSVTNDKPTSLDCISDAYWLWVVSLPLTFFLAFQLDGIFVGATCGTQMRNAMIIVSASFASAIFYLSFGLTGLMASFVGYLALRGLSLW